MKILFILTKADEWGGVQIHIRDLALALMNKGHQVLVASGEEGHAAKHMKNSGIEFIKLQHLERPIQPLKDIKAVIELRKLIKSVSPDIVALHSSKAGFIGRLACKMARVPCLFTAHGWAFTDGVGAKSRKLYTLVEKIAAPWAARIITVSENDRQIALDAGVGRPEQIITIHNGMPEVSTSVSVGSSGEPIELIMVARFSQQKAHEQLLQALAPLKDLKWHLTLIGEGENKAECEDLATTLDLDRQISFRGQVDNVADFLATSDVFVLATNWEGLPCSIIEAMRAGLPVVANDVGGVSELVQHGENGYLIPRGDIAEWTQTLATLIQQPSLIKKLGDRSWHRYKKEFSFERMLKETLDIYETVASSHN